MNTAGRVVAWSVAAVAAGVFGYTRIHEAGLRREYNAIIAELVDQGRPAEAVRRLEPLLDRGSSATRAAVRRALAQSYRDWAHAEGTSPAVRQDRLRKAGDLDPVILTDQDRRLLEAPTETPP